MSWNFAHEREVLQRTYELAAEMIARDESWPKVDEFVRQATPVATSTKWAKILSENGFSEARIQKELRRIDGLTTGRLIRKTTEFCRIQAANGKYLRMTRDNRYVWARSKKDPPCLWDEDQAIAIAAKVGGKAMPPVKRSVSIVPARKS